MPGTTTPQGYPYPLGGDPIDVADDIKRLAEAIDNDMVVTLNAILTAAKVYANAADLGANAPRVQGNVVKMADGSQWRYDGTKWVLTYSPPTAWQNVAMFTPTVALGAPIGPLQVRTTGNYVEFRGGVKVTTLTSNGIIGTIPAGHVPEFVEAINPSAHGTSGTAVLWSTQVQVANAVGGFITASGQGSTGGSLPQPFYGDVEFGFGGIRLGMAARTIA